MGIIIWFLIGAAAGSVAKLLMPGPNAGGMVVAIFVGMAGGLIGGLIGTFTTTEASTAFDVRSLLMAMIGTLFLLFSYRCLALRSNSEAGPEYQF